MFPVCQATLEFICCIFLTLELLFDSGTLFSLVIVSNQPDWFVAAQRRFSPELVGWLLEKNMERQMVDFILLAHLLLQGMIIHSE